MSADAPVAGPPVPRYRDLPREASTNQPCAWSVFGRDDQRGTVNFQTPQRRRDAARLARQGKVFSLNWRLDLPDPPILGRRPAVRSEIDLRPGTDDFYDTFYPQASSQWDALKHVGHETAGFWRGLTYADVTNRLDPRCGIEHWARTGIVGRFVLIDLDRRERTAGGDLGIGTEPAPIGELEQALARQGTTVRPGDVVLIRFGWTAWYESTPPDVRRQLAAAEMFATPGLSREEATAAWLWDNQCSAVASDCPALEAMPFDRSRVDGFLHYRLVVLLGMAIGELFDLDALAADCASDGVYEGLFTAAPFNAPGGSGSCANALALK
jgi:kynurenine formamidase